MVSYFHHSVSDINTPYFSAIGGCQMILFFSFFIF